MGKGQPRVRGVNPCPICRARSRPGSGATCEHYLGTVRKRELIRSSRAAEFAIAWTAVQDAVFGAYRNPHVVTAVLHSALPCAPPEVRPVIECGVLLDDPFFWVDDTEQARAESGYALYHGDPAFLPDVIRRMHQAARWIKATLCDPETTPARA